MPKLVSFVADKDAELEFNAKVTSLAQAILLEKKHAHQLHINWISSEMICAIMTGVTEPCICNLIEQALLYAVENNHLEKTSLSGNRSRFFLP